MRACFDVLVNEQHPDKDDKPHKDGSHGLVHKNSSAVVNVSTAVFSGGDGARCVRLLLGKNLTLQMSE